MASYLDLMARSDRDSRQLFRAPMCNVYSNCNVREPFEGQGPPVLNPPPNDPYVGSHSDAAILQASPDTNAVKRYVIIDGSQRDWVKQPNVYSNLIFTFGRQSLATSSPPIYENNTFVPTNAVEQTTAPAVIPGLPNTNGWSLNRNGTITRYAAYNSSLLKGNLIGYDTGYTIQASGAGFGSVFTPCNVSSIRLVRAVMPQRQFLDIPIVPGDSVSSNIQTALVGKPFASFTTYPYLLFQMNEFSGQYVGGNEPIRRSFSVMTQKQRTQTDFQISIGVQQYDYEPWGQEALQFQSPITNLQRVQISVTDPNGLGFPHSDTLTASLIQATTDGMYLKCFTADNQYFSGNVIRVGDRIVFYPPTLSNLVASPTLAFLPADKKSFITALEGIVFPVLQLLDYVPDSNGLYNPRTGANARTGAYIASYNGFLIPNFVNIGTDGGVTVKYPNSIDSGSYNVVEPIPLVGSNIPFLNTTLQPVFTLELDILQPDISRMGGRIVV